MKPTNFLDNKERFNPLLELALRVGVPFKIIYEDEEKEVLKEK